MRTQITAIHFNATDALQVFTENEVQRLLKFSDNITNCEVEFTFNKQEKRANIHVSLDGTVLNASTVTEDFHKSVVLTVDKLETQVKKHKDKIHAKH